MSIDVLEIRRDVSRTKFYDEQIIEVPPDESGYLS